PAASRLVFVVLPRPPRSPLFPYTTLFRSADLERVAGGLPTLAVIPEVEKGKDVTYVAARDDARSPAAEAYRSLRTALKFTAIDQDRKSTCLNSSHVKISYAVFCLKKKTQQ